MTPDDGDPAPERPVPTATRRTVLRTTGGGVALALSGLSAGSATGDPAPDDADPTMPTYGAWTSSEIVGGGYLLNVRPCPSDPDRYYVYSDVAGIFRSDDGGETWRMIHGAIGAGSGNQSVRTADVRPDDADEVLLANGSNWTDVRGVQFTEDGGETWETTLKADVRGNGSYRAAGDVIARNPADPDEVLFAPLGRQVWKDFDGVSADDVDYEEIDTGIYRSTDGGRSWTEIPDSPTGTQPVDLRYDPEDPGTVYLCAMPMSGWQGTQTEFWQFAEGAVDPLVGGLYRSTDGGDTWERLDDPDDPAVLTEIRSEPGTDRLIGIRDESVPVVSTDRGETWTALSAGLEHVDPDNGDLEFEYNALTTGPDFTLLGAGHGTVYRLPAGADAWTKVYEPDPATIDEDGWWGEYEADADEFQHFGAAMSSLTVDPRDPDRWFMTDWYSVYQTHDAGDHWDHTTHGVESTVVFDVQQDLGRDGLVHLGMADNNYFRSTDGGASFDGGPQPNHDLRHTKNVVTSQDDPSRLYTLGIGGWVNGRISVSDDHGETLELAGTDGLPAADPAMSGIDVDPTDADHVVAALPASPSWAGYLHQEPSSVYRSTDGAQTWTDVGDGLPESFFTFDYWQNTREIALSGDGSMVAISWDKGSVYRFDPAAETWHDTGLEPGGLHDTVLDVVADPHADGVFYVAADIGPVYRSTDGGRTWSTVYDGRAYYLAVDERHAGRVAAGIDDGVALSIDGGEHWHVLDRSLPYRVANRPGFVDDRLVVGTKGNGAFWIDLVDDVDVALRGRPGTGADEATVSVEVAVEATLDPETIRFGSPEAVAASDAATPTRTRRIRGGDALLAQFRAGDTRLDDGWETARFVAQGTDGRVREGTVNN